MLCSSLACGAADWYGCQFPRKEFVRGMDLMKPFGKLVDAASRDVKWLTATVAGYGVGAFVCRSHVVCRLSHVGLVFVAVR